MASTAALPPNALDDRRGTVIGSVVFCLLWSTMMVAMRLWTRGVVIKQLGIDDYMCVLGLVSEPGPNCTLDHVLTKSVHGLRHRRCHCAHDHVWPGEARLCHGLGKHPAVSEGESHSEVFPRLSQR